MHRIRPSGALRCLVLAATLGAAPAAAEELAATPVQAQLDELMRQNTEMQRQIRHLQEEVADARDEALAARDMAEAAEPVERVSYDPLLSSVPDGALASAQIGRASFQLLDISLDTLFSAGGADVDDEDLLNLQGGEHDPRQKGFNLQQVEVSFLGAVDPFLQGEAHLIYFLDPEGESRFELEEAFLTTMMLPFGLEEHGLQLEAGQFFTEFGRINPRHPHAWAWQDQPFVWTRFFGSDGIRAPGVRLGWLLPLVPWFSEIHVGVQNSRGETMVSFLANDEVFAERPIGGRPFVGRNIDQADDMVYLARWVNSFDLSDSVFVQVGGSGLFGPNATGLDGRATVAGGDFVLKWRPVSTDRGWPFVTWQTEVMGRWYEADAFSGTVENEEGDEISLALPSDELEDWGLYTQLLWGFLRGWAAGVRFEYGDWTSGENFDLETVRFVSPDDDPFRDRRIRVSPLLQFWPSEFSRLRLQYNYDNVRHLDGRQVHGVWAGVEFLFGHHPAHDF